FADEVIYSLFAKQSEDWDLLHEDLEQIDDVDIEEMDINWQIAMIAIRMKNLSHLIKDYDYYEKKKAREAEVKRVVNTGNGMAKPVWTNINSGPTFIRTVNAKGSFTQEHGGQ
ncbi:hypothetical protein Tco_0112941, partial [Tanacetum coccineum]